MVQSQSYEEYYDSSSYPYQDEEDRQWDSGGYCGSDGNYTTSVYHENKINKRRNSQLPATPAAATAVYAAQQHRRYDDDTYSTPPTPSATSTTRRKMPQIPTQRRVPSRQGSLNDGNDGCRTPDNSSHRGASLPPTPTATPKLLARLHGKPSASLPPTPGRQLPKPNLNHRSANSNSNANAISRRTNLLKRASSAEYAEETPLDADTDGYYTRPGAISVAHVYNEDYNYAYQSIDNLQAPTDTTPAVALNGATNHYLDDERAPLDDYGYGYDAGTYDARPQPLTRRKKLAPRRENSPLLLQQNTDSLESRDDELKDSFETAASSIASSIPQQGRRSLATYDTVTATPTVTAITTVTTTQHIRDQTEIPKAIASFNGAKPTDTLSSIMPTMPTMPTQMSIPTATPTVTTTTAANVYTSKPRNTPALTRNSSRLLKQQDSIDRGYFNHQESIDQENLELDMGPLSSGKNDAIDNYRYGQQGSLESYTEEPTIANGIADDYNGKAGKESPVSVIHVETYEPTPTIEEEKPTPQQTSNLIDPYHPALSQITDPYAPARRTSVDPYRPMSPSRRTSGDGYTLPGSRRGSAVDQYDVTAAAAHRNSLEPYGTPMSRRTSVRHSPNQEILKQDSIDQGTPMGSIEEHDPEKKSVSFEEEEEVRPARREITAKQRWHWAYNKIIMQLNVSIFPLGSKR